MILYQNLIEVKSIEIVEEMKILGITVSNDLKWKANTTEMTKKA